MSFPSWLRNLMAGFHRPGHRPNRRSKPAARRRPCLLRLEALEDRSLLSTITDLGTLGGTFSEALGINNAGQVVGYSTPTGSNNAHAFLYSNGQMTDLAALLGGSTLSEATGINNAGQVVGYSSGSSGSNDAFLYSNGQMIELGGFNGSSGESEAYGINDAGQVVGQAAYGVGGNPYAFVYSGGKMNYLEGPGVTVGSEATGINDAEQVVGHDGQLGWLYQYNSDPSVISPTIYLMFGGGAPPNSAANAINGAGEVVGDAETATAELHAFLYANGQMMDLGTLGGPDSWAYGINSVGQVVGSADTSTRQDAFLYRNGHMTDLNNILSPNSGWVLYDARAINDSGQIVGYGVHNGAAHAFLLTLSTVQPTFDNLSAPTITEGTATTAISGQLSVPAGQNPVPAGETVQVTLNGVTQTATLDSSDNFSTTFDTSALTVAGSPYTISFAYAGDANYNAATGSSMVTVVPGKLPDIVMDSVETKDSQSVTFAYSIDAAPLSQSFDVGIYRSTTPTFDLTSPTAGSDYLEVALTPIDPTGDVVGQKYTDTVQIPGGLPPDPSHPYVLAVANPDGLVTESDSGHDVNDTKYFRIYTIGVVVPGYGYTQGEPPVRWEQDMVAALKNQAQYDQALVYNWNSSVPNPNVIINAGRQLAKYVQDDVRSSLPKLAPNDVVDVNLIGHSRGAVVVSGAAQWLANTKIPQLQHDYLELTLLDPHPANNVYGVNASVQPTIFGEVADAVYQAFQDTVHDPGILIPANVAFVSEYYQQTPWYLAPIGSETFLNPWGLPPQDITLASADTVFESDFLQPSLLLGHSEVHDWYTKNIVPLLDQHPA